MKLGLKLRHYITSGPNKNFEMYSSKNKAKEKSLHIQSSVSACLYGSSFMTAMTETCW